MRPWESLADGYLKECGERGLSEETLSGRRREMERFGAWMRRRRPRPKLEEIGMEIVVRYLRARTAFRGKATVCGAMSHLRGMGEYLVREGVWAQNPLRWIRGPRLSRLRVPRRIGREEMQQLWESATSVRTESMRYRSVAFLGLLYGTGLRRGELARLDVGNWDREGHTLRVEGRKTERERIVPLPASVEACVEAYLPHRHNALERAGRLSEEAMFVNRKGERVSLVQISLAIHGMARRAKVTHITCHQFRHSCASDLLDAGVDVARIANLLGHASMASTMRYTDVAGPARREAIGRHPINGILCPETEKEAAHG